MGVVSRSGGSAARPHAPARVRQHIVEIVSDSGEALGRVSDIILESGARAAAIVGCSVVREGHEMLVPILAGSGPSWGEALVMPAAATKLAAEGLSGFRLALDRARAAPA